jgi:hypothetical protein
VALTWHCPTLRPMLPLLAPSRTVRAIDCGRHKPAVNRPWLARLMLCEARLTQRGKSKAATLRVATTGRFAPVIIPTHEVGAYQRAYHAGVLRCSCPAGPFAQVSQERDLFLRQVQGTRCSPT